MPHAVSDVLSYSALTEAVEVVKTGIPRVLPSEFWTTTEDVSGTTAQLIEYAGTRRVARVSPYGAPARQVEHLPVTERNIILLSSREEIAFRDQLTKVLREWEDYKPQQAFAMREIARQGEGFRQRFENLEIAAVQKTVAGGVLYFDGEGNLLPSATGAVLIVDQGVPASNKNQLGGLIGASWALPDTDIIGQVNGIKKRAVQTTGFPLRYAFYGENIPGYFARNNTMKNLWAFNLAYQNQYLTTGQAPKEMLELIWIPVQSGFWEDQSGTVQQIFPADGITFAPEINQSTWTLYRGSELVPTQFGPMPTGEAALRSLVEVFGRGRYAKVVDNPVRIMDIGFTNFLPRLKNPLAWYFANVAP